MERKLLHVVLAVLLVTACAVVSAQAATNILTSTLTDQTLTLDCSVIALDQLNLYSYQLTNPLANLGSSEPVHVGGFTLNFPGVDVSDFVITQTPAGWVSGVVVGEKKLNWKWINFADTSQELDPGETFEFAFTTALPFGSTTSANASAQDGFGFSGRACGPGVIIPEPMSMMLGLMGLGGIVGLRKLKR